MHNQNAHRHIVWLTPGFPTDESDTRCIPPLQDLALKLSKNPEITLSIVAMHYPASERSYEWHGLPVYACGANNCKLPFRNKYWKRAIAYFTKLNAESKVNTIHSFWLSECAWLGQRLGKRFGLSHINTLMGQEGIKGNIYERLIDLSGLKLITISPYQSSLFEKRRKKKPDQLIPWGLNTEITPVTGNECRSIDLLGVGSLIKLKDYNTFITIAASIKKSNPDLQCELIGEGPERQNLERMAREQGLENNIRFRGLLSREEVIKTMANSKVLLHPSTYESFGMVFLEALCSGMSVVSRPVGAFTKSERWHTGNTTEELLFSVKDLLLKNLDHSSLILHSMDETSKNYSDLYQAFR